MQELLVDFHHLTGWLRGRGGLARMVGTRRARVSRLARPATGTRLHDLDGSELRRSELGLQSKRATRACEPRSLSARLTLGTPCDRVAKARRRLM